MISAIFILFENLLSNYERLIVLGERGRENEKAIIRKAGMDT